MEDHNENEDEPDLNEIATHVMKYLHKQGLDTAQFLGILEIVRFRVWSLALKNLSLDDAEIDEDADYIA